MSLDLAILIARLVIGLGLAAHGSQKLFGWFGGYGIKGTGGFMEALGFRPGSLFATLAGASEFFGGLLVALGFAGPIGPAIILATMIVAIVSVHISKGFLAQNGGWEMPGIYSAAVITFACAGYGMYSIDANVPAMAALQTPTVVWSVLGLGVVGGIANLLIRRVPKATPSP